MDETPNQPNQNKSILEKFKDFFAIRKEIRKYESQLNLIAEDILALKEENKQLSEELFTLREENKRLNELILSKQDELN